MGARPFARLAILALAIGCGGARAPSTPARSSDDAIVRDAIAGPVVGDPSERATVGEGSTVGGAATGDAIERASEGEEVPLRWLDRGRRLPVVHALLRGRSVRLLVDTGANAHFLERGAARRLGIAIRSPAPSPEAAIDEAGTVVHGASGEPIGADHLDAPPLELGLRGARAGGVWLAIDAPPLALAGLAGVLSPQLAAPEGGALELDLRRSRIRVLDAAAAARVLAPARGWTPLRSLGVSAAGAPMFSVDGEIDGAPARMLVDTGADVQDAGARSPLAARLASRATARAQAVGIGGARSLSRVGDVAIAVAGWRGTGTVRLEDDARDVIPGLDGAIGMEVLQHCTLVVSRDRGALRCAP